MFRLLFFILIILLSIIVNGFVIRHICGVLFGGKRSVPFVKTSRFLLNKISKLDFIKEDSLIIDLGSGLGDVVFSIAKKKDVKVVGVEINYILFFISQIRKKFIKTKGSVEFLRDNLLNIDLKDYDVIILFTTPHFLNKYLIEKMEKELKLGTKVISNTFAIKSKSFQKYSSYSENLGLNKKLYVYEFVGKS